MGTGQTGDWIGSISEGATKPQLGGRWANILPCLLMELWLEGHFVDHRVEQKKQGNCDYKGVR